jgi:hypothetical protein
MMTHTNSLAVVRDRLEGWVGAIMFPCLLYLASRLLLVWAARVHWVLSALLALIVAAVVGFLFLGLNRSLFRSFPTSVVLSLFASIALLSASVCSAWSYILMSRGIGSYTATVELHPGVFADFYLWHLIDMIPGFRVWETLGIEAPVKANDPIARLPVLTFRVFVVLPILALFKKWYDLSKKKPDDAARAPGPSNHTVETDGSPAAKTAG